MKLIEMWRSSWRLWSIWALALLMAMPEIYNELTYSGVFNTEDWPTVTRIMQGLAGLGIVARLVKQNLPYDRGGYGSPPGGYYTPPVDDDGEAP